MLDLAHTNFVCKVPANESTITQRSLHVSLFITLEPNEWAQCPTLAHFSWGGEESEEDSSLEQ